MKRIVVLSVLTACGGGPETGSGIDGDKPLVELSDGEITDLCEYTISLGPIFGDCGNGEFVQIGKTSVGECLAQYQQRRELFTSCTATVANAEDCTNEILPFTPQMLCDDNIDFPDPCDVLFTNECGGL
ncbi:MAG: hypothetical protein ABI867_06475 [Kofleriaceae bacterium]